MGNEVKIKLTDAQKAKIKEATGRDLPEIRVETFGNSPAVSTPSKPTRAIHAMKSTKPIAMKATKSTKPIAMKATKSTKPIAMKATKSTKPLA
jgi:hypothetical protein